MDFLQLYRYRMEVEYTYAIIRCEMLSVRTPQLFPYTEKLTAANMRILI